MSDDTRTLVDLANAAIRVQDACNLSGVVHSFSRDISRLRVLLKEQGRSSTEDLNTHPICVLWADKIASLTRLPSDRGSHAGHYARAFNDVHDLATPERVMVPAPDGPTRSPFPCDPDCPGWAVFAVDRCTVHGDGCDGDQDGCSTLEIQECDACWHDPSGPGDAYYQEHPACQAQLAAERGDPEHIPAAQRDFPNG